MSTTDHPHAVIPAQAGIQCSRRLAPDVRRDDGFFWGMHD